MDEIRMHLLLQWEGPDVCQVLREIKGCVFGLGASMSREQANRFENIPSLFPQPRSQTGTGRTREQRPKKRVWQVVWDFIQAHPMFGSNSIDGILHNFDLMEANSCEFSMA
jgi:hypothetical protein